MALLNPLILRSSSEPNSMNPRFLFAIERTFIEFGSEDERTQSKGIENYLRKLYYIFTKKATAGITPTVARRFD